MSFLESISRNDPALQDGDQVVSEVYCFSSYSYVYHSQLCFFRLDHFTLQAWTALASNEATSEAKYQSSQRVYSGVAGHLSRRKCLVKIAGI